MNDKVVFIVREKDSHLTRLHKKASLFNTIMVGIMLAIKLRRLLREEEQKNQKGE